MKKEKKRVAILYSGGLDSTYLIYDNLKKGNTVYPYYIDVENNINKSKVEKSLILKNYKLFEEEFGQLINKPEIILKSEVWLSYNNLLSFKQLPLWLIGLSYIEDLDEIHIGYIGKDDAIPYLDDIVKLYKNMDFMFYPDKKRPKLLFPLKKLFKEDIIHKVPDKYLKNVSSCENPYIEHEFNNEATHQPLASYGSLGVVYDLEYKFCGECDACKRILNNDYLYKTFTSINKNLKEIKIKQTIQEYNRLKNMRKYEPDIDNIFKDLNQHPAVEYEPNQHIDNDVSLVKASDDSIYDKKNISYDKSKKRRKKSKAS